jgi:hemerythrin-like domain-containing protein
MQAHLPDPANYNDPIRFFRDCHGVIENEVKRLERLVKEAEEHPSHAQGKCLLDNPEWHEVIYFFANVTYRHEKDEEDYLFPVLIEKFAKIGFRTPLTTPAFLTKEHRELGIPAEVIEKAWKEYLRSGTCSEETEKEILASAKTMAELYKKHMGAENELIYRVANDELLTPEERILIMEGIRGGHSPQVMTQIYDFGKSDFSSPAMADTTEEEEEE